MLVKRKRVPKKTSNTRKKKQQLKDDDRDWAAGLPDHLLELVIEKLPLVDCLSFSDVCMPWRSTTTKLFKGSSLGIPLLVKPGQSEIITRACLSVLDKNNRNSTFDIPMPEEYIGSHLWGSYRDWLFLARPFQCRIHITLLNPFSGEKVVLPATRDKYHMVVLSSVPSDPRCIYMLVGQSRGVAFWTSGAPREWRECGFTGSEQVIERVTDALYHEGHFYLLKCRFEMATIDEKSVLDMLYTDNSKIGTHYLGLKVPCLEISSGDIRKSLVESSGDILLVCRIFYDKGPHFKETCGYETFRLDLTQRAWVKLESLGDKIIFIGRSCSRSFHAKEELGDDAVANHIYFSNNSFTHVINNWESLLEYLKLRDDDDDVDDWGVISLHENTCVWPRAFRKPGKHWAGFWVTAPAWWCLRQTFKHHR